MLRPPGPWEIALILLIILIIFGVGKLPQVGDALGKGMRAFRKGQIGEDDSEDDSEKEKAEEKPRPKKTARKRTVKS
ncbi:twin-arginine translocase TatA/TatE family subunit [Chloroflexota bacterium]